MPNVLAPKVMDMEVEQVPFILLENEQCAKGLLSDASLLVLSFTSA